MSKNLDTVAAETHALRVALMVLAGEMEKNDPTLSDTLSGILLEQAANANTPEQKNAFEKLSGLLTGKADSAKA